MLPHRLIDDCINLSDHCALSMSVKLNIDRKNPDGQCFQGTWSQDVVDTADFLCITA